MGLECCWALVRVFVIDIRHGEKDRKEHHSLCCCCLLACHSTQQRNMTVVHLIFPFFFFFLTYFFVVVSSIPSVRSSFIFLVLSLYTKLLKALQRAVELFIWEGCTRYKRAKAAAAQNHRPSGPSVSFKW